MDFSLYASGADRCSQYHSMPIEMLDEFRKAFPGRYRIRYRGPRAAGVDPRRRDLRQSVCLKRNATHFSAYRY